MMKLFSPTTSSSHKGNVNDPEMIDAVYDHASVPDNDGEDVFKEENTFVMEQPLAEGRASETIPESLDEKHKTECDSLEKVLSKFDMNCCVKNPTKQIEETAPESLNVDDEPADKGDDPSLSDIAARMNDIDLESGGTADYEFHGDTTKHLLPWYREPFYAGMIVLCISFTIAIIVMSVLLFKK
jgi:hypothetical protein